MSENIPRLPEEVVAEQRDIRNRPEYSQACQNTKLGGDLIKELLNLGVPETEVKIFALARLEENIRAGYGLNTVRSLAKQGGLLVEAEVDSLFEEIKDKMSKETPTETEEEKTLREARELEEMLKMYE